jgi:hypothetical protein
MIKYFLYFLGFLVILLFSAFITGRTKRAYPVLDNNLMIVVNGQSGTVNEFAEKYRPVMYKQEMVITPPILWVWYNAVDMGDRIDYIYYNVWENEINPNPLVHRYYSFFRAFYYGYPLYDIEYIQITVSKSDGVVDEIRFETGPSDNYYSIFNEHIVVKANRKSSDDYQFQLIDRDTRNEIELYVDNPKFTETHIKLGVQTWNHLSTLIVPSNESVYTVEVPCNQLKYLSNEEYANAKFVRKSQGDHITTENKLSIVVSVIAIFVFVTIPAKLLSLRKKG